MEVFDNDNEDITRLSIEQMAERLTNKSPSTDQLAEYMMYVDAADHPQEVAKQLFLSYAAAQSRLPYGVTPNDLIVTAQSFLRGFRKGMPLEERQREIFTDGHEYDEASLALQSLREKCMQPTTNRNS